MHFAAPDSTFRDAIASGAGAVLSKAYGEEAGDALGTSGGGLLCTGPYKLDSWTPGSEIVTVANDDYWDGAPLVKTLTYTFIPDGTDPHQRSAGGRGRRRVQRAAREPQRLRDLG